MDPRYLLNPKQFKKEANQNDSNKKRNQKASTDSTTLPKTAASPSLPTRPGQRLSTPIVSSSSPASPSSARSYDPRALLNPRGNKASSISSSRPSPPAHLETKMPYEGGESADIGPAGSSAIAAYPHIQLTKHDAETKSKTYPTQLNESQSQSMQGSSKRLLEGVFGVESREDQPRKKVKADTKDDSQEKKGNNSTYRKGTGVIGEYMKQKPESEQEIPVLKSVVDLTNDQEDDDDIQIVGSKDKSDDNVCYGMLWIKLNAHRVPRPLKSAGGAGGSFSQPGRWPPMKCTLIRKTENKSNAILDAVDPVGEEFATVDKTEAVALVQALDALRGFNTDAVIPSRPKKPTGEWPGEKCSYQIAAFVNLFGRRGDAERIGRLFGQQNLWLLPPTLVKAKVEIVNPHTHKRTPLQAKVATSRPGGQALADNRTNEEIVQHMASMIDEWAKKQDKELPETEAPPTVNTPLLSHQKQALTFMLNREKPRIYEADDDALTLSLWRKKVSSRGVVYEDIVSGQRVAEEPAQVFGGLLADVMGLGKTLEALALVASTAKDAEAFGKMKSDRSNEEDSEIKSHAKGTLIVCPTSTVQNWETQIREHLDVDVLSTYIYHGQNRTSNAFDLKNYDLVVTTYGTVASDARGNSSILEQLKWFRIILDEAHTIREHKAQQSQACYRLSAQRRWCLTGTPIQNRLSDLGSLTRFLRLSPYNDPAYFNQYIASRAATTDEIFMDRLRLFVDSFVLRRLRDKIDLPDRKEFVSTLEFTAKEQKTHDFFKDQAMIRIEELLESTERKSGVHLHMLKGITTLRLICAHDRDLLKEKELRGLQGLTVEEAIDLDEEESLRTITKRDAYENFNLMAEADQDFCVQCYSKLTGETPQANGMEDSGVRCYVLPCLDTLCPDCFAQHKPMFDASADDEAINCPSCALQVSAQYVAIDAPTTENIDTIPDDTLNEDARFVNYKGPKTKVKALLADLAAIREQSAPLQAAGERPLKTVVFSEFTSNLTLIEKALDDKGYCHARIDGTMSLPNRRKVLDAFDTDDSLTILLASIKAAGQGLNLTAASRAFIMEPMWNPAAEQQAVDRIYRIGQKREVVIIRYQIKDSIEVKITELAKKKLQLAGLAMDKSEHRRLSKAQKRERNLKDIQSLFK